MTNVRISYAFDWAWLSPSAPTNFSTLVNHSKQGMTRSLSSTISVFSPGGKRANTSSSNPGGSRDVKMFLTAVLPGYGPGNSIANLEWITTVQVSPGQGQIKHEILHQEGRAVVAVQILFIQ